MGCTRESLRTSSEHNWTEKISIIWQFKNLWKLFRSFVLTDGISRRFGAIHGSTKNKEKKISLFRFIIIQLCMSTNFFFLQLSESIADSANQSKFVCSHQTCYCSHFVCVCVCHSCSELLMNTYFPFCSSFQ